MTSEGGNADLFPATVEKGEGLHLGGEAIHACKVRLEPGRAFWNLYKGKKKERGVIIFTRKKSPKAEKRRASAGEDPEKKGGVLRRRG